MKKWEHALTEGVVCFIVGVSLFVIPLSMSMPSAYHTFLGIPYEMNPDFVNELAKRLALMGVGVLLIGAGIGTASSTYTIYCLEKKLAEKEG